MTEDFDTMSVEELEEFRISRRNEMRRLREEILASNETYRRKLSVRYLGARLHTNLEGLPATDIAELTRIINSGQGPSGGIVVTPEPGIITLLEGSSNGV